MAVSLLQHATRYFALSKSIDSNLGSEEAICRVESLIHLLRGDGKRKLLFDGGNVFDLDAHGYLSGNVERKCSRDPVVREGGVEPPRVSPPDPKSGASTNSAILAKQPKTADGRAPSAVSV